MWSVTNYFLLNLTLADILMATLNCIFSFIYMRDRSIFLQIQNLSQLRMVLNRNWHFGSVYCNINQFISYSTVPASVFTMLAITLDRRRAIMNPLSTKISKLVVITVLIMIWSLCTTIALPPTIYSTMVVAKTR